MTSREVHVREPSNLILHPITTDRTVAQMNKPSSPLADINPSWPGDLSNERPVEPEMRAQPTHSEIAKRAYDIYVKSGFQEGNCTRNWLEAESSLSK